MNAEIHIVALAALGFTRIASERVLVAHAVKIVTAWEVVLTVFLEMREESGQWDVEEIEARLGSRAPAMANLKALCLILQQAYAVRLWYDDAAVGKKMYAVDRRAWVDVILSEGIGVRNGHELGLCCCVTTDLAHKMCARDALALALAVGFR